MFAANTLTVITMTVNIYSFEITITAAYIKSSQQYQTKPSYQKTG